MSLAVFCTELGIPTCNYPQIFPKYPHKDSLKGPLGLLKGLFRLQALGFVSGKGFRAQVSGLAGLGASDRI